MADVTPRISVVIAVRNGAGTLERALESVFGQTYPNVELVVIDGASTDGTQAILERHADRIAYWHSEPDRGIYDAWNKALDHVTGDWICFLGADDRFAGPEVLATVASLLMGNGVGHRVAYGQVRISDNSGSILVGDPWEAAQPLFARRMAIPHQAVFHHRTLFEELGRFDRSYRICGDYELLLREVRSRPPMYLHGVLVTEMGADGLSARPESAPAMEREFHRARYRHGLTRLPHWLSFRLFRAWAYAQVSRRFGASVARRIADAYHGTGRDR